MFSSPMTRPDTFYDLKAASSRRVIRGGIGVGAGVGEEGQKAGTAHASVSPPPRRGHPLRTGTPTTILAREARGVLSPVGALRTPTLRVVISRHERPRYIIRHGSHRPAWFLQEGETSRIQKRNTAGSGEIFILKGYRTALPRGHFNILPAGPLVPHAPMLDSRVAPRAVKSKYNP